MTFETQLAARNTVDYADFLLPQVIPDAHVLDVGCGAGTIQRRWLVSQRELRRKLTTKTRRTPR
jgi:16S rRNA G1207 methylase RsmC